MAQRTRPVAPAGKRQQTPTGRRRRRTRFDRPPPHPFALSGWALLPLRAFLGFTFCFAGLQKLANPNFFDANSPSSIQAQLIASIRISPLHQLLGHLLKFAVPIGILIALAELAVGLGALLGLWTRVAAAGGIVLSLTLFLTVSFHSSPYYTGADIVFLFAWIPLLLAGSGGVLSLDAVIASRVAAENKTGPPTMVPVRFELVQQVCGHYEKDTCTAQAWSTVRRPWLPVPHGRAREHRAAGTRCRRSPDPRPRRQRSGRVGGGGRGGRGGSGRAGTGRRWGQEPQRRRDDGSLTHRTGRRRHHNDSAPSRHHHDDGAASGGTRIGLASQVPVGGAATFKDPATGDPGLVLQLTQGQFVAYDAVCPHAGCTVGYSAGARLIVCPCHGSEFDPTTGDVISPPAPRGLTPIHVAVNGNGELLADG